MVCEVRKVFLIALAAAAVLFAADGTAMADEPGRLTVQPQALNYAGITALKQTEPSLTGAGVKFGVICRSLTYIDGEPQDDYRPDPEHNCLKDTQFTFNDSTDTTVGISAHSTAICSILFGNDPDAFNPDVGQFNYQGVAPQAQADVYEFWHFLTNNVFPHLPPDADILSASIGSQFEDWWTRGIESLAEQHGLVVVAGIGNGTDAHDPLLYPASSANVIGVGVVDCVKTTDTETKLSHFSLVYPKNSSFGPTKDRRCKPDIVAPGNCLAADTNETNRYEPTGSWSSFSTPIVAGTAGLLVQKAKQDSKLAAAVLPEGGNCVIKAILLNSATKLPYWHKGRLEKDDDHSVPLAYSQGAGILNALQAYRNLVAGQYKPSDVPNAGWDNNLLDTSENSQNTYSIKITDPEQKYITATVVWNRHYNNSYPFEPAAEKDANLRLQLWAIDRNNEEYLVDYSDSSVDNVEHIYYRTDSNYSDYELVVSFSDTQTSPPDLEQQYGLAWSVSEPQQTDSIFWYDLNADGIVNELDFIVLAENMAAATKSPDSYLLGDINTDGAIDINDVEVLFNSRNLKADWYTK